MKMLILSAALLGLSAPALAETNVWKTGAGFTIRTGDVDRTTTAGRAALLKRVEFAGRKLCAGAKPRRRFEACVEGMTARTMAGGPEPMRKSLELAIAERDRQHWAAR